MSSFLLFAMIASVIKENPLIILCFPCLLILNKRDLKGKGDLALDTRLEVDGGELLDDLSGGVEVDQTLVDLHLVAVPGLGTLTARGLAGGDAEDLGGEADGTLDTEVLVLGTLDEVGADLLEVLDVAGGQGDADAVDRGLDLFLDTGLGRLLDGRHVD